MTERYGGSLILPLHQCQGINIEASHIQLVRLHYELTLELKSRENFKKDTTEIEKHLLT